VVPGGIGTERKGSARVKTTMTTQNLERLDQLTTETTLLHGKNVQLQQSSFVSQVTNLRKEFGLKYKKYALFYMQVGLDNTFVNINL